jgi:hypothetical protein
MPLPIGYVDPDPDPDGSQSGSTTTLLFSANDDKVRNSSLIINKKFAHFFGRF